MRAFGFGPGRRTRRSGPGGRPAPAILALSTPLLFEGDSNTAWAYQITGWLKQALRLSEGRFYVPVGGDFAVAGAVIGGVQAVGDGSNSIVGRQTGFLAKVRAVVALKGHCVVWFEIGTNGGTLSADLPALAVWVTAVRQAGARVGANTAPLFGQNPTGSYVGGVNTWITTAGNVDFVNDVNALPGVNIVGEANQTHYTDPQNLIVGQAVATILDGLIVPDNVYADPAATVDDFAGTGGTLASGMTGQVPTGWALGGFGGTAAASIVDASGSLSGRRAVRLQLTCTATDQAVFSLSRQLALTVAQGDVVDGWATVSLVDTSDDHFEAMLDIGGGQFPSYLGTPLEKATWSGTHVWRAYPVNQPAPATQVGEQIEFRLLPGQTATVEIAGFAHCLREHSAVVAPVNTAAPVAAAAIVGGSPTVASAGTYTGSQPITLRYVYYLDATPLASGYVYASGDVGKAVTAHETATNAGGSVGAVSAGVTVAAATPAVTATTLDPNVTFFGSLTYSNGNRTVADAAYQCAAQSIAAKAAGKWYVETHYDTMVDGVGIGDPTTAGNDAHNSVFLYLGTGTVYGTNQANGGLYQAGVSGFAAAAGDRIGLHFDADGKTIRFRRNGGPWSATFDTGHIANARVIANLENGQSATFAFAQDDWVDTPPAGAGVWAA